MARLRLGIGDSWPTLGRAALSLERELGGDDHSIFDVLSPHLLISHGSRELIWPPQPEPIIPLIEAWTSGLEAMSQSERACVRVELSERPVELNLFPDSSAFVLLVCRAEGPLGGVLSQHPCSWREAVELVAEPLDSALEQLARSDTSPAALVSRLEQLRARLDALESSEPRLTQIHSLQPIYATTQDERGVVLYSSLDTPDSPLAYWVEGSPPAVGWLAVRGEVALHVDSRLKLISLECHPLMFWVDLYSAARAVLNSNAPTAARRSVYNTDAVTVELVSKRGAWALSLERAEGAQVIELDLGPLVPLLAAHISELARLIRGSLGDNLNLTSLEALSGLLHQEPERASNQMGLKTRKRLRSPARQLEGAEGLQGRALFAPAASIRHLWLEWDSSIQLDPALMYGSLMSDGQALVISTPRRVAIYDQGTQELIYSGRGRYLMSIAALKIALVEDAGVVSALSLEDGEPVWWLDDCVPSKLVLSRGGESEANTLMIACKLNGLLCVEPGSGELLSPVTRLAEVSDLWALRPGFVAAAMYGERFGLLEASSGKLMWEREHRLAPRFSFMLDGRTLVVLGGGRWKWGVERLSLTSGELESSWSAPGQLVAAAATPERNEALALVAGGGELWAYAWQGGERCSTLLPNLAAAALKEAPVIESLAKGWLISVGGRVVIQLDVAYEDSGWVLVERARLERQSGAAGSADLWISAGERLSLYAEGAGEPLASLDPIWEQLQGVAIGQKGRIWALERRDRPANCVLHSAGVKGYLADYGGRSD